MATLNWIGKEAVVNHHRQVPYRLLKAHADLSVGEDDGNASGNLLVQGDNLEALKALLPYYGGKVKCIYIDPPYNTGNEGWVYNDNVNSPQIRAWLEKTLEGATRAVGKEGEDLSRHDKWLCMMYPRLALLREFLTEDGAIFVSIDDNEVHHLRCLMDEVFGARNFVANVIWEKSDSPRMDAQFFSNRHDHVVVYARAVDSCTIARMQPPEDVDATPAHYDQVNESGSRYYLKPLRAMGGQGDSRAARPNLYYAMLAPDGTEIFPKRQDGVDGAWRWSRDKVEEESSRIEWKKGKQGWAPYFRIYADDAALRPPETIWFHGEVGSNRTSKAELKRAMPELQTFSTPKPTGLIERVVNLVCGPSDIIMDSFAGSGTTGHAVLAMNKADGGNRKFILVEMDETIATTITRERLARVVEGYHPGGDKKKPKVEGLGGGFRYASLGPTLFDEYGRFRTGEDKVTFAQLAAHIYFTQTGEPLPKQVSGKRSPLIGTFRGTAYYLLYNGILGDKTPDGGNVLTREVLAKLPPHPKQNAMGDAPRVVFGEACRLSESTLRANSIVFKQIPYQVEVG